MNARSGEAEAPGARRADDAAIRKNLLQLIQLRWIAVAGQIVTIAIVELGLDVDLPLIPMGVVLASLVGLNLGSLGRLKWRAPATNAELFTQLGFDALALTTQLFLSGGATNPFAFLFLLHVMLSAVLLETWSTWAIVAITTSAYALLTLNYRPLVLPVGGREDLFSLHVQGMVACFVLNAALLVVFVTRIGRNLKERDARLAALRQRAAEEDHVVRMGLLASGAAHELGTPLATLDVILNDWRRMPAFARDPELLDEIADMQAEVRRCKTIVSGILMSAGEARGEAPAATTMRRFLSEIVADRRSARLAAQIDYDDLFGEDVAIVSDPALKQVVGVVIDNAAEASPDWVGVTARRDDDALKLVVVDHGPGFAPETIDNLGKPYNSTKGKPGGGLGLFLVTNVMRKLGGAIAAGNRERGGAIVTLTLPLAALAIETKVDDAV
ncbi:MAG: histidine kinase [Ancylobacter novellus]|uniref:histidine kinase n=1 Tax=Ancylobacter novellus TaxID=921 RepID=A0A2W5K3Q8_ANCNO|nr:MAG: histidine kinase [Ancylobacter novellus]